MGRFPVQAGLCHFTALHLPPCVPYGINFNESSAAYNSDSFEYSAAVSNYSRIWISVPIKTTWKGAKATVAVKTAEKTMMGASRVTIPLA